MFINDTLFNSDTYYYYEDQRILVVMILIFFWVHTMESPTKSNLDTKQIFCLCVTHFAYHDIRYISFPKTHGTRNSFNDAQIDVPYFFGLL